MLAHHTVGGCPMTPGDLLGSGTISGPTPDSVGSFLELSKRGAEPFELDGGEKRVFLEDGDEVELRGWADDGSGKGRVGFGSCRGSILPAHSAAS
jgi:fumarylacetoacetase